MPIMENGNGPPGYGFPASGSVLREEEEMREELTQRQKEVLREVGAFLRERGMPPTVRELSSRFGFNPSTVFRHMRALERKGYLRREGSGARAIVLTEFVTGRSGYSDVVEIPVLGRIAAGAPLLAEENIEETITIERRMVGSGKIFFLKVTGDSMTGDHILDGDYVMVRPQPTAEQGEIVAALIGDEATVKRFYRRSNHLLLAPSNPRYSPLRLDGDEVRIIGKVVGVLRRFEK